VCSEIDEPASLPGPSGRRPSVSELPDELHPRHLWRRVAQFVLAIAVVGVAVAAAPGLGGVRHHLERAEPSWLLIGVMAELASALSYVVVLRAVFCRRMQWRRSYQLGMSELAADSLLPAGGAGGLALGAWALRRSGMPTRHIARRTVVFFLVTSAANFAAVIVAGVGLALGLLPGRASLALTLLPASLAGLVVLLVVLVLPRLLDRVTPTVGPASAAGGRRGRARRMVIRTSGTLAEGVRETASILRAGRPLAIAGSVGYLAFDSAVLAACFAATGSALPPLGIIVLAYTIGQLGGLIPLPGGIGATGGGLVAAFVLYGASIGPATAAVLLYRALQLGVPALLGPPAFVLLHRALGRRDAAMPTLCEPLAEDDAVAA
jgi:uncharacterized membrane protein YbhN (UPF0104 family)